ncbi:hypothetical protein EMCRGX_G031766 [Ephydatia muelleri]
MQQAVRIWPYPLRSLGGAARDFSVAAAGSTKPTMPPCNFTPKPYKGMTYEDTVKARKDHLVPGMVTYYKKPLLIDQGHMQWLFDYEGKRYLDLIAGIVTVSVGHCHPKVNARAQEQQSKLWHTTNIYMHPTIHQYVKKLAAKMPGNLKVVYLTNSGGEANDLAMVMARLYTGSYDIISLKNGYHGAGPYCGGLTALNTWRFPLAGGFGIHHATTPDVFRGPWGGANCRDSIAQTQRKCNCPEGSCNAANMYAEQLNDVLKYSCSKKVAAFFAEPIQGVGGTVQHPKTYLKQVYAMVRERGGLCVSDEVQTGFGRLGTHFWGFEANGVIPDIVTMAKGIGNGYPMGAVVTTPEIAQVMSSALHFNTFGGNPVACAVASAVLDVIEEDKLQENSRKVGDVRGKGLMLGVEFVKSKKSVEPLPATEVNEIWERLKDSGVLVGKGGLHGNVFRIKPPMCITAEDVHFAVAVLRQALSEVTKK